MRQKNIHIILIFTILLSTMGCSVKKYVPEGKHLVAKNTVITDKKKTTFSKSDLASYIIQKPYRKRFSTNFKIWIYYVTEGKTHKKVPKWFREKFGTKPEYYDKAIADKSSQQIELYLDNVGYFNSQVTNEVVFKRHKAKVKYNVKVGEPYYINELSQSIADTALVPYIEEIESSFPVHEGDIYNAYTLDDQRELITTHLRNNGYYFFNRDYIRFEVDSSLNCHKMNITMKVDQTQLTTGETAPHKQYTVNRIDIYPDYSLMMMRRQPIDSVTIRAKTDKKNADDSLHFHFYNKPRRIRPKIFRQQVLIEEGSLYSLKETKQTYNGISNLPIFSNVGIEFDTTNTPADSLINCRITMQRNDVHSVTAQFEGTNSAGDLGIRGNVSYSNKNIFRGSEVLRISIKGGLEAQHLNDIGSENDKKVFNTTELGVTGSLFFPRFLSAIPLKKFAREYLPRTTISVGFNMQIRYYYSRYITSASFGYDWKANNRLHIMLTPVFLNSVKVNPTEEFTALLDKEQNQRIKDQYTNHLLLGSRVSMIYNSQDINKKKSFVYLSFNFESSGNLLWLFNNTKLITEKDGHHEIFGIRYAQYLRGDVDFRQYFHLGSDVWFAFREIVGIGFPYGNSTDIPIERSFYGGGANDMRGWRFRRLGPGEYHSESNRIERLGDIQLEMNAELRFPIAGYLTGALFADAGNIWTFHANEALPGGQFDFKNFYKQIAFDAGFGLRLDLSFLLLRLDLAIPMRYPYLNEDGNSYWHFKDLEWNDLRFVIGLGHPF